MTEQREGMTELGEGKTELDKLIKAAEAVDDAFQSREYDDYGGRSIPMFALEKAMEALRQAVEQAKADTRTPVAWAVDTKYGRAYSYAPELMKVLDAQMEASVEPVGMKMTIEQSLRTDGKAGQYLWWKDVPHGAFIYTTPPSIDALIGEIDGLAINFDCPDEQTNENRIVYWEDLNAIVDKYRSVKQ